MPCEQRNMASKIKWTKVNDGGLIPRPRHGHRAIAVQELMIVFGGGNEGIVDDLHAYNTVSNQWFCPVVKGDVPRGVAAFGLAADDTRLLFFGGMVEYGGYTDALHELQVGPYFTTGNISSKWEWKKLKPKVPRFAQPPSARLGHSFTFVNGKFYLFGGLTRDVDQDEVKKSGIDIRYSNDLYFLEFRGSNCFWEMPHTYGVAPSPRESHTAVGHEDSLGNPKLLIYGGMAGFRLGDIFVLDLSSMTWTNVDVDGPAPQPRSLHTSSVVGEKMYVFGGWVPLDTSEDSAMFQSKWMCTDTVAQLNLNTYKWEEVEVDCREGCPRPRAGHSAVVVGSRIYVWSGRDGYTRAWDVQVCFKDMWFLEVGKPAAAGKVHLIKAGTKMMELTLPDVPFCDHYILQIMPYSVPVSPKEDTATVKKKRKIETDWADDDIGPMLPPTSPLPRVPLPPPKPEKPLPLISICDEELPSFLTPPKPPAPPMFVPPPKPLPRLVPPSPIPPQPFMNNTRVMHHPPMSQPFIQHPIVRSTAPPIVTNTVQYVPVQEFTRRFPAPDPRMANPVVINKPFKTPAQSYPSVIDFSPMTPIKTVPHRATVVKVVNSTMGSFSNVKVQPPPNVFSRQPPPPPKHTIFINKPVNKPGQQIVVVSSAPIHRPQTIQTIQTIARHDDQVEKRNKIVVNGVKTFPVQQRLPQPQRVQVQNPNPAYKEVKVQVNGKTLTVMMPLSSGSATPVTTTQKKVMCFQSSPTVLTSSSQPKFSVRQETLNPPKASKVNAECRTEAESSKEVAKVVKPDASKIIGTPVPSCSGVVVGSKPSGASDDKLKLPDPPSDIKISKVVDGAIISWSPPSKGPEPMGYSINLGVKADGASKNKITFVKVYADVHTKTHISQGVLDRATLSFPKPTIIFRVSSFNEHGSGSSTQVRWLQDPHKNESTPGPTQTD